MLGLPLDLGAQGGLREGRGSKWDALTSELGVLSSLTPKWYPNTPSNEPGDLEMNRKEIQKESTSMRLFGVILLLGLKTSWVLSQNVTGTLDQTWDCKVDGPRSRPAVAPVVEDQHAWACEPPLINIKGFCGPHKDAVSICRMHGLPAFIPLLQFCIRKPCNGRPCMVLRAALHGNTS